MQRDEGEEGGAPITEAAEANPSTRSPNCPSMHTLADMIPTCSGLGSHSIGARGVPDSGAVPECTEPPLSTLLLSVVHPVTLYTRTQPSTASRELCGTLSARAG
jgi:hypothetical protein